MTLAGPKAYSVNEVIALCEKLGGAEANVSKVPVLLLKFTRGLTRFFHGPRPPRTAWRSRRCSRRGSSSTRPWTTHTAKLGMDPSETTSLEEYMEEYFSKILKKLKEVGGQSRPEGFLLVRARDSGGDITFFQKVFH